LFLDEFAEFPRNALEVLRQPLEDGHVGVSRAAAAHDFPSRFMLVAAMNPCPCGYYSDPERSCRCSQSAVMKYQSRVSGPLIDRIDIQIEVPPVKVEALPSMEKGEPSAAIRERVEAARAVQASRYRGECGIYTNADAKGADLREICKLSTCDCEKLVRMIGRLGLSARAYDKILRVARTCADLDGVEVVKEEHLSAALQMRHLDREQNSCWI
jgi:magnesium chelatase family protein